MSAKAPRQTSTVPYRDLTGIGGWLSRTDAIALAAVLAFQRNRGVTGDVLEIGAFEGRSAAVLAAGLAHGETLHVCDLFEDETSAGVTEFSYGGPTRAKFEQNLHGLGLDAGEVHQCLSSDLGGRLAPASYRLVHVDGSHLYPFVRDDLALARTLLIAGGIVVADDYRKVDTPGVAAAVWQAVRDGLQPVLLTAGKLYATWHPDLVQLDELGEALRSFGCPARAVDLDGRQVLRAAANPPTSWRALRLALPPGVTRFLPARTREQLQ